LTDNILTDKLLLYAAAASTFIAGILHLAIIPMFFKIMPLNITLFFLISGLAQVFWVIPVLRRWSNLWFYVGIAGKVLTAELTMISLDAHTHMSIIVIEPKYYLISSIDKKFPEGSLNHAIFGLP